LFPRIDIRSSKGLIYGNQSPKTSPPREKSPIVAACLARQELWLAEWVFIWHEVFRAR
jgi:hypothetical protein